MIYLYLKTHNITGLKYLGKTARDPFKYKGSGFHWKRHLAKHGNDVTTEILFETLDNNELIEKGKYYSVLWNVVDNPEFANLRPEDGDGGDTITNHPNIANIRAQRKSRGVKCKWWNNGTSQHFCESPPDSSYVRGRGTFNNVGFKVGAEIASSRRWINDGLVEYMFPKTESLPAGFTAGRLIIKSRYDNRKTVKGTSWWNNGVISVMKKDSPGESFVKGRLPKSPQ